MPGGTVGSTNASDGIRAEAACAPWMTAGLSTELVGAQEPWTPGARGREQDRLKGSGPGRTFPERRAPWSIEEHTPDLPLKAG
jgi:hypothetical protein